MSAERRTTVLAYSVGALVLLWQLYVLWGFIEGTLAEYAVFEGVQARELMHLVDWLKAPLWRKRWFVGYAVTLAGLGGAITLALIVMAVRRCVRPRDTELA